MLFFVYSGYNTGQTRPAQHVRMSGVQNENTWSYLHMDIQFENQRQTSQMDVSRCCIAFASLIHVLRAFSLPRQRSETGFSYHTSKIILFSRIFHHPLILSATYSATTTTTTSSTQLLRDFYHSHIHTHKHT